MTPVSDRFVEAFPSHTVSVTHRPDGTLTLTLQHAEGTFNRVISREAVLSEQKFQQVIRDIQRDIKIAAGELSSSGAQSRWIWSALPTYESGPIHVTRAKRLAQRPLAQLGPRRQSTYLSA